MTSVRKIPKGALNQVIYYLDVIGGFLMPPYTRNSVAETLQNVVAKRLLNNPENATLAEDNEALKIHLPRYQAAEFLVNQFYASVNYHKVKWAYSTQDLDHWFVRYLTYFVRRPQPEHDLRTEENDLYTLRTTNNTFVRICTARYMNMFFASPETFGGYNMFMQVVKTDTASYESPFLYLLVVEDDVSRRLNPNDRVRQMQGNAFNVKSFRKRTASVTAVLLATTIDMSSGDATSTSTTSSTMTATSFSSDTLEYSLYRMTYCRTESILHITEAPDGSTMDYQRTAALIKFPAYCTNDTVPCTAIRSVMKGALHSSDDTLIMDIKGLFDTAMVSFVGVHEVFELLQVVTDARPTYMVPVYTGRLNNNTKLAAYDNALIKQVANAAVCRSLGNIRIFDTLAHLLGRVFSTESSDFVTFVRLDAISDADTKASVMNSNHALLLMNDRNDFIRKNTMVFYAYDEQVVSDRLPAPTPHPSFNRINVRRVPSPTGDILIEIYEYQPNASRIITTDALESSLLAVPVQDIRGETTMARTSQVAALQMLIPPERPTTEQQAAKLKRRRSKRPEVNIAEQQVSLLELIQQEDISGYAKLNDDSSDHDLNRRQMLLRNTLASLISKVDADLGDLGKPMQNRFDPDAGIEREAYSGSTEFTRAIMFGQPREFETVAVDFSAGLQALGDMIQVNPFAETFQLTKKNHQDTSWLAQFKELIPLVVSSVTLPHPENIPMWWRIHVNYEPAFEVSEVQVYRPDSLALYTAPSVPFRSQDELETVTSTYFLIDKWLAHLAPFWTENNGFVSEKDYDFVFDYAEHRINYVRTLEFEYMDENRRTSTMKKYREWFSMVQTHYVDLFKVNSSVERIYRNQLQIIQDLVADLPARMLATYDVAATLRGLYTSIRSLLIVAIKIIHNQAASQPAYAPDAVCQEIVARHLQLVRQFVATRAVYHDLVSQHDHFQKYMVQFAQKINDVFSQPNTDPLRVEVPMSMVWTAGAVKKMESSEQYWNTDLILKRLRKRKAHRPLITKKNLIYLAQQGASDVEAARASGANARGFEMDTHAGAETRMVVAADESALELLEKHGITTTIAMFVGENLYTQYLKDITEKPATFEGLIDKAKQAYARFDTLVHQVDESDTLQEVKKMLRHLIGSIMSYVDAGAVCSQQQFKLLLERVFPDVRALYESWIDFNVILANHLYGVLDAMTPLLSATRAIDLTAVNKLRNYALAFSELVKKRRVKPKHFTMSPKLANLMQFGLSNIEPDPLALYMSLPTDIYQAEWMLWDEYTKETLEKTRITPRSIYDSEFIAGKTNILMPKGTYRGVPQGWFIRNIDRYLDAISPEAYMRQLEFHVRARALPYFWHLDGEYRSNDALREHYRAEYHARFPKRRRANIEALVAPAPTRMDSPETMVTDAEPEQEDMQPPVAPSTPQQPPAISEKPSPVTATIQMLINELMADPIQDSEVTVIAVQKSDDYGHGNELTQIEPVPELNADIREANDEPEEDTGELLAQIPLTPGGESIIAQALSPVVELPSAAPELRTPAASPEEVMFAKPRTPFSSPEDNYRLPEGFGKMLMVSESQTSLSSNESPQSDKSASSLPPSTEYLGKTFELVYSDSESEDELFIDDGDSDEEGGEPSVLARSPSPRQLAAADTLAELEEPLSD